MEATELMGGSKVTEVEMLLPLPSLQSVSVEASWQLGRLTGVADGGDGACFL